MNFHIQEYIEDTNHTACRDPIRNFIWYRKKYPATWLSMPIRVSLLAQELRAICNFEVERQSSSITNADLI